MEKDNSFDYVIAGLGAAGCVLAARLAEDENVTVAVIEASADYTKNPYVQTPATFAYLWDNPLYPGPGGPFTSPPYVPPFDEWSFKTDDINQLYDKPYTYPRGIGYGGSASHHALTPWIGSKVPYDKWAEITGDLGWSYKGLLPYFRDIQNFHCVGIPDFEKYHSRNGWLSIDREETVPAVTLDTIKAAEKMGLPFVKDFLGDPDKIAGVGFYGIMRHQDTGIRSSSAVDLFIPTKKRSDNITVIKNSLVTKILFDKKCKLRAIGLELEKGPFTYEANTQFKNTNGKKHKIYAKREVILCGGAINTPQLLMLSGIGPRQHLQSVGIEVLLDRPGVGSNLQDHLEIFVNFKLAKPYLLPQQTLNAFDIFDPKNPATHQFKECGKGPLASNVTPAGFDWFSGVNPIVDNHPDLHVQFINVYFADWNIRDWVFLGQFDPSSAYQSFIIENADPKPPFGTIRLKNSDPHLTPIIDEKPLANDTNTAAMANGVVMVRNLFNQNVPVAFPPPTGNPAVEAPLGVKYGAEEALPTATVPNNVPDIQNYIKNNSANGHHISCTCAMGKKSDRMAVVDKKLKVIGVQNLRIVDASIFPVIPSGPPVIPVYVVAERAADIIKKKYCKN